MYCTILILLVIFVLQCVDYCTVVRPRGTFTHRRATQSKRPHAMTTLLSLSSSIFPKNSGLQSCCHCRTTHTLYTHFGLYILLDTTHTHSQVPYYSLYLCSRTFLSVTTPWNDTTHCQHNHNGRNSHVFISSQSREGGWTWDQCLHSTCEWKGMYCTCTVRVRVYA